MVEDAMTAVALILAIAYIGGFGFAQRIYLIIRDEVEHHRQHGN
jgi:hypothetical protein